jgi:hypothetical protein
MKPLRFLSVILLTGLFACSKQKASCSDGITNQGEAGTDCGGPCTPCASCSDGIQNQNESGADCGGVCLACATCSDGVQNQNETGIDCGGICAACPTCSDGIQNQGETGTDCGVPCPACPTPTNPATQNTSLLIGGNGWSNSACSLTNSLTLKGYNGPIEVTMSFATAISSGTYALGTSPGPGVCAFTALNAPNQPAGILWYGKNGMVVVNQTAASITATLSNIICTQQNFNFPVVTASGSLSCN